MNNNAGYWGRFFFVNRFAEMRTSFMPTNLTTEIKGLTIIGQSNQRIFGVFQEGFFKGELYSIGYHIVYTIMSSNGLDFE